MAMGGIIGAVARYSVYHWCRIYCGSLYSPLATLLVNTIGCAALGLCLGLITSRTSLHFFIIVGILGSFTTFSTFIFDIYELLQQQRSMGEIILFVVMMIIIGITAFLGGLKLGQV